VATVAAELRSDRNREFWVEKFSANRRRDAMKIRALRRTGFRVVVIWECQGLVASVLSERVERFVEAYNARNRVV